ncbi:amidohydrolase family protein [Subtercola lobariae]|uniref:Amidohydrolase n=1 Tax=Subtercola lobariae TaxID=1588641 RepID=A0A917BAY0_9MICO|nr:amidohydrolase family protein [Subtercola lobariae]GGF35174.1 amidohydrolase [Subtercola lobariae]
MFTIGLEEHFVTPDLVKYGAAAADIAQPKAWADASRRLLDVFDERLALMDETGLDVQVLSLNSPGLQAEADAPTAVRHMREVNDFLAGAIADHPTRFGGFAALALQDPNAAADELERTVTELGMSGALVNAHTQGRYLDDPAYDVVWERAEQLDVPLYLHPANGVDFADVLTGHPELIGPMWSWGLDTSSHVLRLIFGGVFDRHPNAKLLLGHMGEALPYVLWRLDSRWGFHNHRGIELALGNPSEYLKRHLYVTTSGVCDNAPLRCAIDAMGIDHVLFATDYPFEEMGTATEFIETAALTDAERAAISHENAARLLRIAVPAAEGRA